MLYKYWEDNKGRSPVIDKIKEIESVDAISARSFYKHLERLEKYDYLTLTRHKIIKKLKGNNPYKIQELRFMLPQKISRTFFVIARDSKIWLLHLMIKKDYKTQRKDIYISEQRAKILNEQINYL